MSEQNPDQNVNLSKALDLEFWSEELSVRVDELKEIVKLVGPSLHDIRFHLTKRLMMSAPATY